MITVNVHCKCLHPTLSRNLFPHKNSLGIYELGTKAPIFALTKASCEQQLRQAFGGELDTYDIASEKKTLCFIVEYAVVKNSIDSD